MKTKILIILTAISTSFAYADVPIQWITEASQVNIHRIEAWHGETLNLHCTITEYGKNIGRLMSAKFYWQTNRMDKTWWQSTATFENGVVNCRFTPQMDPGADEVRFFFALEDGNGGNYRANGIIKYLGTSPGVQHTILDLPKLHTINFEEFEVINAPWVTAQEIEKHIVNLTTNHVNRQDAKISELEAAITDIKIPSIDGLASEDWVQSQGYLKEHQDLSEYATEDWVQRQGYLTEHQDLSGYATEDWVQQQGFLRELQDLSGYATEDWVQQQGYLTEHQDLSGYATENWVQQQGYLTEHQDLSGYATIDALDAKINDITLPDMSLFVSKDYLAQQGYLTEHQDLSGYATEDWVHRQGFLRELQDLSGYATEDWVQQQGYLTEHQDLSGYATEDYVDNVVNRITDANQKGNYTTKLFAPNGSHYIDGTGVVWKAIQKCYWLEDGWQTPFYPSDETWKWNNPESGWSMSYNPKTQDYTLYPSTNSPLVNHSYVVGNSDYDGTMILHQDLRVGTEGFFTNMIINLTRINTDGAWFIPTNHIVFSDDKRLRHNGVITNDIIMTDGAKIYEYSPGQIPAKVFSVQFNDALADHPEDGDYDLCRYNGYIDVYIPQTTPMPPIGENQRIENVYVKAELHMHYIQLYGYEPLLPEHMSFAGIFPNSSFTYQYTSTNDYLFGFLADNKNSNLMSDAFFSYFHFGNGSEDRKFFWRHGLRSSIHFFKTYDLDLDVGSITFSTRDDVYIDNVKKPYGGQGNELIDQKTNIKWEPCFYDGNLYYIATTNTIEVTK